MSILQQRVRWLGVEFIVISLGVLSALFVDTWIQDRADEQRYAEYRERLIADLQTDIENLTDRKNYYDFIRDAGLALINVLEGRADMDDTTLLFTAFNAAEEWGFVEQSSTFTDMQSTGHLALIKDLHLRLTLARYYREMIPREQLWTLPDDYRRVARGVIPNDFQSAVHNLCSNLSREDATPAWQIEWYTEFTDPVCLGDTSRFQLTEAAARLRSYPGLVELLRYRVSQTNIAARLFEGQIAAAGEIRRLLGEG